MNTLLVVNVLFYAKDGLTQRDICERTFQSKQTVNLIIRNLLNEAYVTVEERKENLLMIITNKFDLNFN